MSELQEDIDGFYDRALEELLELAAAAEQHSRLDYSSTLQTVDVSLTDAEAEKVIQDKADGLEQTHRRLRKHREKLGEGPEGRMWWEEEAGNGFASTGVTPRTTCVYRAQHLELEEEIEKITSEIIPELGIDSSIAYSVSEEREIGEYLREKEQITRSKLNDIKYLRNYQRRLLDELSIEKDSRTIDLFIDEDDRFLKPEELEVAIPEDREEIENQVRKASEQIFEIWRLYRDEVEELEDRMTDYDTTDISDEATVNVYRSIKNDWRSVTGTLKQLSESYDRSYVEPLTQVGAAAR